MNLKLKNAKLEAKVMLKFNFVSKTPETFTSVRPAITQWAGLVPEDAVLHCCNDPRKGDYKKVETKGLMEEAMKLQNPNFFSLVDCTSAMPRLVCVLLTSRIFPVQSMGTYMIFPR